MLHRGPTWNKAKQGTEKNGRMQFGFPKKTKGFRPDKKA